MIDYILIRKSVKRIILKIDRQGNLTVSAPKRAAKKEIDRIVERHSEWVLSAQKARLERNSERCGKIAVLGKKFQLCPVPSEHSAVYLTGDSMIIETPDVSNSDTINALADEFLNRLAKKEFAESVDRMLALTEPLGITPPKISVRKMTSRWGSCTCSGASIRLNRYLIGAPREIIDYVALHELIHFRHRGHDGAFYSELERFMPDWKQRKKTLICLDLIP